MKITKREVLYKGFVCLEKLTVEDLPFNPIIMKTTDSVAVLLFDATNDRVLLVRQERAAMVREDNPDGLITEMVAGRFDVELGPKALLIKESKEEAGVEITEDEMELINGGVPMALSAGVLTERCYGGFAVIHPDKVSEGEKYGVVVEGETITRVWQSADDFIKGPHEDWRVWAFAQFLAQRRLEIELGRAITRIQSKLS